MGHKLILDKIFGKDLRFVPSFRQLPNILALLNKNQFVKEVGMVKKCNRSGCLTCPILLTGNIFKYDDVTIKIKSELNCISTGIVYALVCQGCKAIYIGETSNELSLRINLHRSHANNPSNSTLAVSKHLFDCSHDDIKFKVIPLLKVNDKAVWILGIGTYKKAEAKLK
jgi:hypothetical protein